MPAVNLQVHRVPRQERLAGTDRAVGRWLWVSQLAVRFPFPQAFELRLPQFLSSQDSNPTCSRDESVLRVKLFWI